MVQFNNGFDNFDKIINNFLKVAYMFQKIFNFFGDEQPKEKLMPQLYVQYINKDSQTKKIQQKTIKCDYKIHPEFEGWKRLKFESYDRTKALAHLTNGSFVDPDFPHTNASISQQQSQIQFEWKRIPDLIKFHVYATAETYQNFERISISNKKLKQALLFMYRTHPSKFKQLLAKDCNNEGLYEYKLYKNGVILNVMIDDYVPVLNGVHPLMVGPVADREIFPMLIQKAIAKICGGYDKIPESLDELLQILFCGPLRKTKIQELTNTEVVSNTVDNTLKNGGVGGFISKNNPKLRSFGISQNQIYHIVDKFRVDLRDEPSVDLYELVSEKKLASWNGRFSHNDAEWEKVNPQQRSILFNKLKIHKSFFISGNDAARIFDHLIVFDGTDIANKQWIELQSEVSYSSFTTFELTTRDTIFIRTSTADPVRNSLILAQHLGKDQYKFIKGAFHESAYSVQLTHDLYPGKYIICSNHDWILNKTGTYSVFLSSNTQCILMPTQANQYPSFLEHLFKSVSEQAKKIQPIPEFLTLKKCYSIGMLAKETGFAFIDFSLKGTNQKELFIQIQPKVLAHESWQIIEPNTGRTAIHLQKGVNQQLMLILKTHKYLNQQNVQFPSTAFKVKV